MQACTHADKTTPPLQIKREKLSGVLSARSRPAAVVIILKEASVVGIYTATLPSDVLTLAASRKWENLSRTALRGSALKVTEDECVISRDTN